MAKVQSITYVAEERKDPAYRRGGHPRNQETEKHNSSKEDYVGTEFNSASEFDPWAACQWR